MKKIYLDTDIILDLFAKREPNYDSAANLFALIEREKVKGFVSPLIFANLYYILRKLKTAESARQILGKLQLLVKILPINEKIINLALNSKFHDFEDAIQYYTALNNGIQILITRNKKDYQKSKISILTAAEFLQLFFAR